MTDNEKREAERAFGAKWEDEYRKGLCDPSIKPFAKDFFMDGWERKRVKAEPRTAEVVRNTCCFSGWNDWLDKWARELGVPAGARVRVTVEEVD